MPVSEVADAQQCVINETTFILATLMRLPVLPMCAGKSYHPDVVNIDTSLLKYLSIIGCYNPIGQAIVVVNNSVIVK